MDQLPAIRCLKDPNYITNINICVYKCEEDSCGLKHPIDTGEARMCQPLTKAEIKK